MLKNLFRHKWRIAAVILLVLLLVVIRAYEDTLFYDPFLAYFKSDYANVSLPPLRGIPLFANLFLRYFLNTILSLAIIYAIFSDRELVGFAAVLYVIFFVGLAVAFFFTLKFAQESKLMLFYVRRFLIQPLFLLLFIPAFYFQKRASEKNNIS